MAQATMEIQSVSEDVERLRRERPHSRPFVDPFVGLLLARAELVEQMAKAVRSRMNAKPDTSRLGLGASLEPRDTMPLDAEIVRQVFDALHAVLTQGFPSVRTDLLNIGQLALHKDGFLLEVAHDIRNERTQFLLRAAYNLAVEPRTFVFWGVQIVSAIAMARGRVLREYVADAVWNRGYCPVCGSWPSLARVGTDGRELTCSFCGTSWHFSEPNCPFCDSGNAAGPVYAIPGYASEHVRVCQRCNHYLAELDGEPLPGLAPEVEALGLAPLELLARQHGHSPASIDWRQMIWMS